MAADEHRIYFLTTPVKYVSLLLPQI